MTCYCLHNSNRMQVVPRSYNSLGPGETLLTRYMHGLSTKRGQHVLSVTCEFPMWFRYLCTLRTPSSGDVYREKVPLNISLWNARETNDVTH